MSRSSRGLGHRPFTAATGVRIPYGMPAYKASIASKTSPRPKQAGGCFFVFVIVFLAVLSSFCLPAALRPPFNWAKWPREKIGALSPKPFAQIYRYQHKTDCKYEVLRGRVNTQKTTRLSLPKISINTLFFEERVVCAFLNYLPRIHNNYSIHV